MIGAQDERQLLELERAMWRAETRFDPQFQEQRFAPDFIEFGRSGRIYSRSETILADAHRIEAELTGLRLRELGPGVVQITYDSVLNSGNGREFAHRSSIWSRTDGAWRMRFHQGTPFQPAD